MLVHGVYVEPAVAGQLLALMDTERHRYRANGITFNALLQRTIDALEAIDAEHRGVSPLAKRSPVEWISTVEAGRRSDRSAQAIRDLIRAGELTPRRIGKGRWMVDAGAVAALPAKQEQARQSAPEPRSA